MRKRLLTLAVTGLALGAWAGPAVADEPVAGQTATQVAGNHQTSSSNATSTQIAPSNQNINVRVLSPGDNGSVTQSNESAAQSFAGNHNATEQDVDQSQAGSGSTRPAGRRAARRQRAEGRVRRQLDPGQAQEPEHLGSRAQPGRRRRRRAEQQLEGEVRGGQRQRAQPGRRSGAGQGQGPRPLRLRFRFHRNPGSGSGGLQQAEGRLLRHVHPDRAEEPEHLGSRAEPGRRRLGEPVERVAGAVQGAQQERDRARTIKQRQAGSDCGCHGSTAIQAAGQAAFNRQQAYSDAESKQVKPENKALSLRLKSHGGGGDLTQTNSSFAGSYAANWNELEQDLEQVQGDAPALSPHTVSPPARPRGPAAGH